MGPLGLLITGYQLWRRLSPERKAAIRARASLLPRRIRGTHSDVPPARFSPAPDLGNRTDQAVAANVGAATAPAEEVVPGDLTSPGTVVEPELEAKRAEQAVERERESRATELTKFEAERLKQEAERAQGASAIGEPPSAVDEG